MKHDFDEGINLNGWIVYGILQLFLIALKVIGVFTGSWWIVMLPTLGLAAFLALVFAAYVLTEVTEDDYDNI